MTIEEQMYDEIMHKMPHRIIELIKAIDEVSKMLERKGYGKLNDNLDQLKAALEKAQKEQENIYSAVYDKKIPLVSYDQNDLKILLPKSYDEAVKKFIKSGYIEQQAKNEEKYYLINGYGVPSSLLEPEKVLSDCNFADVSALNYINKQNTDFVHFCEHYFNDEGYEGNFNEYIDNNGEFNFWKFESETDFSKEYSYLFSKIMTSDERVNQHIEKIRNTYIEQAKDFFKEQEDIDNFINSFSDDKTEPLKFADDFER